MHFANVKFHECAIGKSKGEKGCASRDLVDERTKAGSGGTKERKSVTICGEEGGTRSFEIHLVIARDQLRSLDRSRGIKAKLQPRR